MKPALTNHKAVKLELISQVRIDLVHLTVEHTWICAHYIPIAIRLISSLIFNLLNRNTLPINQNDFLNNILDSRINESKHCSDYKNFNLKTDFVLKDGKNGKQTNLMAKYFPRMFEQTTFYWLPWQKVRITCWW